MKNNLTLAMTLLLTLSITACSGGNKTGEIPKSIQPGTIVVEKDSNEELEKLKAKLAQAEQDAADAKAKLAQAEQDAAETKAKLTQATQNAEQDAADAKAKLAQAEQDAAEAKAKLTQATQNAEQDAADAKAKLAQAEQDAAETKAKLTQATQNAEQDAADAKAKLAQAEQDAAEAKAKLAQAEREAALNQKATNYSVGETKVAIDELKKAIENGTELQKQAAADGKNINSLIGANAKLPAGTILSTTANTYGGYAVIREIYSDTISGDKPLNSYVAVANTATTDKNAVVDATYKGTAAYSTGNMITLMEKTNTGEAQYELTLNVKDNAVSGGIANTNTAIQTKRAELNQPKDIITFQQANVSVTDDIVGFKGDAQFNYGWGFLPNATGDGKGQYQGVFTGKNAEGVVGTFSTTDTQKENSVQGAFVGSR